jgi:hypothetical protein
MDPYTTSIIAKVKNDSEFKAVYERIQRLTRTRKKMIDQVASQNYLLARWMVSDYQGVDLNNLTFGFYRNLLSKKNISDYLSSPIYLMLRRRLRSYLFSHNVDPTIYQSLLLQEIFLNTYMAGLLFQGLGNQSDIKKLLDSQDNPSKWLVAPSVITDGQYISSKSLLTLHYKGLKDKGFIDYGFMRKNHLIKEPFKGRPICDYSRRVIITHSFMSIIMEKE